MGVRVPVGVATAVVVEEADAEFEDIPKISDIAEADFEAILFAAICRAR